MLSVIYLKLSRKTKIYPTSTHPMRSLLLILLLSFYIPSISFYESENSVSALINLDSALSLNGDAFTATPVSWCTVEGAQTSSQTNYQDILWRRHELASGNVWIPQASITFRSAVNFKGGNNFPIIQDPDYDPAKPFEQGYVWTGSGGLDFQEMKQLIFSCDTAWQRDNSLTGSGIMAINLKLFQASDWVDAETSTYTYDISRRNGYGSECTVIGPPAQEPLCNEISGNMVTNNFPGYAFIIDKSYLEGDLMLRERIPDTSGNIPHDHYYFFGDPEEITLAHEFGHGLDLPHIAGSTGDPCDETVTIPVVNLMCPPGDYQLGDGLVDNKVLDEATYGQITRAQNSAANTPNGEIDPPEVIDFTNLFGRKMMDDIMDADTEYLDLSGYSITVNEEINFVNFDFFLFGLLNNNNDTIEYWNLIDLDNDPLTGAKATDYINIGLQDADFDGADLVFRNKVQGDISISGSNIWTYDDGFVEQDVNLLNSQLQRIKLHSHGGAVDGFYDDTFIEAPFHDIIHNGIPNVLGIEAGDLVRVQAYSAISGSIEDSFGIGGTTFDLDHPVYPHAFQKNATIEIGKIAIFKVTGFNPDVTLKTYLGDHLLEEIFTTDEHGNATLSIFIENVALGKILLTVGEMGTALTADLVIDVSGPVSTFPTSTTTSTTTPSTSTTPTSTTTTSNTGGLSYTILQQGFILLILIKIAPKRIRRHSVST